MAMELSLNSAAIPAGRFAFAFSGGGDSTALLHALQARNPYVMIVDHGLRAAARTEALEAKHFAESLGLTAEILCWHPPKNLTSGVQSRARTARYGLLGDRCRALGFSVLMTGHTQDDQAETSYMRLCSGGSWRGAAAMASVTASPLWPQLFGISLYRPLLDVPRAQIRDYLSAHDLPYADDPSNEDAAYTRVRARKMLAGDAALRREMLSLGEDMRRGRAQEMRYLGQQLEDRVRVDSFGCIYLSGRISPYLLGRLLRAAGGASGSADRAALTKLSAAMGEPDFTGATLGGALIKRGGARAFILSREPSMAFGRAGQPPLGRTVAASTSPLWDGRFRLAAGVEAWPAAGHLGRLPASLKQRLKACPAQARPTLPLLMQSGQITAIGPLNAEKEGANAAKEGASLAKSVVGSRLAGEFPAAEVKFTRAMQY